MPNTIQSIELRNLKIEDYKELKKSMIVKKLFHSLTKVDMLRLLI